MSRRLATRMLRLLERERDLMMSGRISDAARLAVSKDALIDRIESATLEDGDARRIRDAADRNQALIDAAKRGVETARARMRTLRSGVGVNTYSASGTRQMIERTAGSLHKRA